VIWIAVYSSVALLLMAVAALLVRQGKVFSVLRGRTPGVAGVFIAALQIFAMIFIVGLIWPLVIAECFLGVFDFGRKNPPSSPAPAPLPFHVKREHLVERMTLAVVEVRETVHDPLGAVPAAPCGFLNPMWLRFRSACLAEDEIWSFSARSPIDQEFGVEGFDLHEGYVAVRGGEPQHFFLLAQRTVFAERDLRMKA